MDFSGRFSGVAFITGGGSGIGQACALAFAQSGVTSFALVDLALEGLQATEKLLQAQEGTRQLDIKLLQTDVSSEEQVDACVAAAAEHFGRLDYIVNSAGLNQRPRGYSTELTMESYDSCVNVNQRGLFMCQRAEIRQLEKQAVLPTRECDFGLKGSIVNIASIAGFTPTSRVTPYAASKAAVIMITRSDAMSFIDQGIRINAVAPGVIKTAMTASSMTQGQAFTPMIEATPAKRFGQPEEVAQAVLYLSHPLTTFVVGQLIVVDGGLTINATGV